MGPIITNITALVQGAASWIGDTVGVFTAEGNEVLLFSLLVSFVGIGFGLLRRAFKLHA